jgi:hypothetical protein
VNPSVKRLARHSLPVLMIAAMLLVVSVLVLSGYGNLGLNPAQQSAVERGLLTRVVQVRPTANGLAEVTFAQPPTIGTASPSLQTGLVQTGHSAQFSLDLQISSPDN